MFQLAYTPYIWPFIISLILCLTLAVYAFRQHQTPITSTFAWMMLALAFWTACYSLELVSVTLEAKTFWAQMKYFGNTSGPVLWFVLALRLTNHEHWLTRPVRVALTSFCVVVTAVVLTNNQHHWYWTDIWIEPGFPETFANQGFFFWIYAAGPYLMILLSVVLILNYYRAAPPFYRPQATLMALGGFIPLAGRIAQDIFGVDLVPKIDEIPLFLLFSSIFFALAIFRYGVFKIVHVAHNLVIKNITAGIITVDNNHTIVDVNPYAQALIANPKVGLVGRPLKTVLENWSPLAELDKQEQEIAIQQGDTTAYILMQTSPILDTRGRQVGQSLVLFDITARKLAEQAQQRLAAELIVSGQKVAVLEERERIGRELHDDLGQLIGTLSVQAQTAQALYKQDKQTEMQAALRHLVDVAYEAQQNVRQYILGIRQDERKETAVAPFNFTTELQQFVEQLEAQHHFSVSLSLPDKDLSEILAQDVAQQLLRIAQEALTNARKYANVSQAQLFVTLHEEVVQLMVIDNGQGFDFEARGQETAVVNTTDPHFGLDIMRERAESVDGRLEIRSQMGQGTQVIAWLPFVTLTASTHQQVEIDTHHEPPSQPIRVLLADDHALYAEGLRSLLQTHNVDVVGIARDGFEVQTLAKELMPDLILMDVEMPKCDGLEATKQIKANLPEIKVVMLTVAADDEKLFAALRYGASGYLLKSLDSHKFFAFLEDIMAGETVLSPALAARVLTNFAQTSAIVAEDVNEIEVEKIALTSRQEEVMKLVARGLANKEIAQELSISERTVKYHVGQVLARLHLQNRYELRDYVKNIDGV